MTLFDISDAAGKDESNSEKKRRTSPLLKKAEERCPVIRR
jgi:ferredoxin